MAKANMVLPDGTKVAIEGTAEEVALLLAKCSQSSSPHDRKEHKKEQQAPTQRKAQTGKRAGPLTLIAILADEGYFKSKRTLGDIQKKLEEIGHIYAQTSLSPALMRLTRKRTLRRIKEKKGWVYVS
jgi:hypothetical protein